MKPTDPEPVSATPPHRVRPIMRQTWRDLTFLHWRYDPDVVGRLIPESLIVDVCEGAAWIGLVPFRITGLTLPRAPAIPWMSNFPETNVRTYVRDVDGRRGVWFFSLDASRLAAVVAARTVYGLPYFWASMSVVRRPESVHYRSRRLHGRAGSDITIETGEAIAHPSEMELFLTARFRLFAQRYGRAVLADIEHPPWPLQRARVSQLRETLISAAGLPPPTGDPLVHFANRVDVMVAAPRRVQER